ELANEVFLAAFGLLAEPGNAVPETRFFVRRFAHSILPIAEAAKIVAAVDPLRLLLRSHTAPPLSFRRSVFPVFASSLSSKLRCSVWALCNRAIRLRISSDKLVDAAYTKP